MPAMARAAMRVSIEEAKPHNIVPTPGNMSKSIFGIMSKKAYQTNPEQGALRLFYRGCRTNGLDYI